MKIYTMRKLKTQIKLPLQWLRRSWPRNATNSSRKVTPTNVSANPQCLFNPINFSAAKQKTFLRNGLKDVQSRLNKGEKGIVIFAGDVTPIEIMCHLPAVCEDKGIPYAYTPSRIDLGAAMGVKRGTVTLLIREHPDYQEQFNELKAEIGGLAAPV